MKHLIIFTISMVVGILLASKAFGLEPTKAMYVGIILKVEERGTLTQQVSLMDLSNGAVGGLLKEGRMVLSTKELRKGFLVCSDNGKVYEQCDLTKYKGE